METNGVANIMMILDKMWHDHTESAIETSDLRKLDKQAKILLEYLRQIAPHVDAKNIPKWHEVRQQMEEKNNG